MEWMVETYGLTKCFSMATGWKDLLRRRKPGPRVVDHVNLMVGKGELFGLVGPNGAGKTTVIKMLTTLIEPSSGSIRIAGYDIREEVRVKKAIGLATSDERSFYWRLTGRQNLQFFASLHDMSGRKTKMRIDEVISQVELQQVADNRFYTYSTGMRQRLAIARALLTDPSVIFMDEPTKGLDPSAASKLHDLIRDHLVAHLGLTVFLTSHYLREVETLCHRIAVMNKGKIQGCGSMIQLRKLLGPVEKYHVDVQGLARHTAVRIVQSDPQIQLATLADNHICFEFDSDHSDDRLANLITSIQAGAGKIRSVSCSPISLDVIYQYLTGRNEVEKQPGNTVGNEPLPDHCNPHGPLLVNGPPSHAENAADKLNMDCSQSSLSGWMRNSARIVSALTKRDMLSETSYRLSFMMQLVEIFLTVAVLYYLSRLIGQDAMNLYLKPYGGNYFAFAIIGVAFYSYFNVGFSKYASQLSEAQKTGTLEAMLSTPAGLSTLVMGSSVWEFIMTTLKVVVILLSGALIMVSDMQISNYPLALLILLLTIVSASSFGIIAACFIVVAKKGDPISWLFKSASYLLGGVLFPISVFPSWMQKMALLLPTTHALQAMRMTLLQGKGLSDVLPEIYSLCIFCFLLLPLSLRMLKYAVRRAKQEGTLTYY